MDTITIAQKVRDPIKISVHRDRAYSNMNRTILFNALNKCKTLLNRLKDQQHFMEIHQCTSLYMSSFIEQHIAPIELIPLEIEDLRFAVKTINLMLSKTTRVNAPPLDFILEDPE